MLMVSPLPRSPLYMWRHAASVCIRSGDIVQKLINFGARVISGRRKYDRIHDALRDLQWLDEPEHLVR